MFETGTCNARVTDAHIINYGNNLKRTAKTFNEKMENHHLTTNKQVYNNSPVEKWKKNQETEISQIMRS